MNKIDGYVLLALNDKALDSSESKHAWMDGHFTDYRLSECEFDLDDMASQLASQLPLGLTNALVMCFVNYHSEKVGNPWDGYEYEDVFTMQRHVVMDWDFKETYRRNITAELASTHNFDVLEKHGISLDGNETKYFKDLVAGWEEFYDEDFVPAPNGKSEQVIKAGNLIWGIDWSQGGDKSVMVEGERNDDGTITIKNVKELGGSES